MKVFSLIMAGGGGSRFWPLSRQNLPKQLLNISGNDVMINETINRYEGVITHDNTYIITNKSQVKTLRDLLISSIPSDNIFIEPVSRNTASCILLSALLLSKQYNDGIMCIFPSDHYITDEEKFKSTLRKAISAATESECLITIGIYPTFPSTGYGYIKFNKSPDSDLTYSVDEFVEKPDFKTAGKYLNSGNYVWNSGIFIWKLSVIMNNFKRFLPRIYGKLEKLLEIADANEQKKYIDDVYPTLQNISIDYGILERSDNVKMVPGDFGWNDIGSWDTLGTIFKPDSEGNIIKANHIGFDTKNCIVYGNGRLVTTIGIENTIVVETGDAMLICNKNRAQEVKKVVELLRVSGKEEYV